jgi:hypothetical protein
MARHLQPAPLEPTGLLRQATFHGGRVPLVDAARVEKQHAVDGLRV